ncbi:MAG: hypothetical protein QOF62_3440 [Pyrinomonadaceae bacterium]|jgi:hypothetical protein|nr:hypothetical protein [Pyrinomonadaceae bacterium]
MFSLHKNLLLIIAVVTFLAMGQAVFAQHEGHDMSKMPGMSKAKPKVKAKTKRKAARKRKPTVRRKQPAKKHDMSSMPGMNMPGHKMPASSPSPNPQASPQPMDMNMPGMNMPASSPSPNPQASPQPMDMNMPGMNMPASSLSPNPQASPQQKMDMNMPMPAASPATGTGHTHGNQPAAPMGNMDMNAPNSGEPASGAMKDMPGMSGTDSMNLGPLMVMAGNDMGIRVGSSDTNIMSMGAMGSGTTWQPSSGPMHMIHKQSGDWLLMFHYNAVVGVNRQGGPRGVTKFESANWFMPMAYHKLGKGTLQLRGMFSFEPFTFPPGGSPLLFQTGETYKGQPLIDRQHPHDLFMELSAQYTHPVGERGTWFTYFGYPGEPALGPVAFMHRMSASENPAATLAHHLQDSTHIAFGVLTTGFTYRWLKLEGSIFNGREPDENRYNFDAHKWNSRSARISIMPNQNWVIQASYGFLRSPEASEADTDIRRTTASVQYNKPLKRGNWASAFVWGRNHTSSSGETHNLNGYTFESTVNFLDKNYLYTRLELVDKNELLRAVDRARLGITDDHPSFRIGAYTFGGARELFTNNNVSMALGSDVTFYSKPAVLDQLYGNNPVSWKIFLRFRPGKMDMSSTHSTH